MASLIYYGLVALPALACFILVVEVIRRYPPVGICLVCLVIVTVWDVPNPPPIVEISGLSLYPADAVTLLLLVVAVLEAPQLQENLRGWLVPWAISWALIVVSLIRGVATFGLGAAVNESRTILHFLFAMTWVFAVRPDRLKLQTVSLVIGWVLVLVALYHGAVYGIGGATSGIFVGDNLVQTGRVLYGGQAAALLFCAGTALFSPSSSTRADQFATISSTFFFGIVVIAQHRSVWAAGALGVSMVLIWSRRSGSRNRATLLLIVGVSLGFVGSVVGSIENLGFESATDLGTYAWRTSSWQSLVSEAVAKGPEVIAIGQPFGTGYLRQIFTGIWANNSAHNWYVTIFLRLGIIGLLALVGMLVAALARSRSKPAVCTFVLAAAVGYSWAYQIDWYLAPWLGAAMTVSLGVARGNLAGTGQYAASGH